MLLGFKICQFSEKTHIYMLVGRPDTVLPEKICYQKRHKFLKIKIKFIYKCKVFTWMFIDESATFLPRKGNNYIFFTPFTPTQYKKW